MGAHATVMVDRLNLRPSPGTAIEAYTVLPAGKDLLIVSGPVSVDGYDWYVVHALSDTGAADYEGWVAALPDDAGPNPPDDAWLIDIGTLTCPEQGTVDTALLARLTGYAIDNCGVLVGEVGGLVDLCYEGPLNPYDHEPDWAWFSCYFLRDEESTWFLPVHFPPDFAGDMPERGDIVTLAGRLGFDTDKYGACTVTAEEGFPASQLAAEQHRYANSCGHKFVVSGVTVTGHVELPPMY